MPRIDHRDGVLSTRGAVCNVLPPDSILPVAKSYPQSHRSEPRGFSSLQLGHSTAAPLRSNETQAQPPLAGASVANSLNCFINSNVDFTPASGWLGRLGRSMRVQELKIPKRNATAAAISNEMRPE